MRSLRWAARRSAAASKASIWESELAGAAARKTVTHIAAQRPPLVMFIDGGASIAQAPARLAGKEAHMQFFLDTADLKEIQQGLEWGMVDGITSNPSLIAKEGKNYLDAVKEIAELVPGPVSGEVLATDYDTMLEQAHKLATLAENVVIKVPLTPDGLRACRALRGEGTKVNVTLCFSASQALLAAKAGATYISPFIGRLDDVSTDGMHLIEQVVTIYNNYDFETQVLVASARHPLHIVQSALLGADVVTMPFKVMEQLYKHPLTDVGLEKFISDWKKTGRSFDETAVEALADPVRR